MICQGAALVWMNIEFLPWSVKAVLPVFILCFQVTIIWMYSVAE